MMIDPKGFRKGYEDSSLNELFNERDKLIKFMQDYENHRLPADSYLIDPSPDVIYLMNMEYLVEIFDLIKIKMREEDFSSKVNKIMLVRHAKEMLSDLDEDERNELMERLKKENRELYDEIFDGEVND